MYGSSPLHLLAVRRKRGPVCAGAHARSSLRVVGSVFTFSSQTHELSVRVFEPLRLETFSLLWKAPGGGLASFRLSFV